MAEDMGEKTEEATPKRRSDARSRGQVAKSQNLSAGIGLLVLTLAVALLGGGILRNMGDHMRAVLSNQIIGDPISLDAEEPTAMLLTSSTIRMAAVTAAPIVGVMVLTAVVAQVQQVGLLFTTKPIQPKLTKLNPLSGAKKLVKPKNLMKGLIDSLKLIVAITLAYVVLRARVPKIAMLPRLGAPQAMLEIGRTAFELALALAILLFLIGVIDFFYQKWQHAKDLRMTKQEVKDERKNMEGDMDVKRRRFAMHQKIVSNQIKGGMGQADVVITNPTHFAVAISYRGEEMRAPKVVAKGADLLAYRIRQLASLQKVPVIERPPLARALYYGVDVGREIHPEHYEAVAEILAFVYRADAEARSASGVLDRRQEAAA